MKEKVTPHLKALAGRFSIDSQYRISETEAGYGTDVYDDPLLEEEHEVVKGLVHKYTNRALVKLSYLCAAHCRFCTRKRQIGDPAGTLNEDDLKRVIGYLQTHPEIDDVILSGGDPFYTPKLTGQLLQLLQAVESVKVIRIGTRLPLQSPVSFNTKTIRELLAVIDEVAKQKPFYILLHINHPDELTTEVINVIKMLRRYSVTLLSQTVFLNGINDSFDTLYTLFRNLYHMGVMPYYLYRCDAVNGLQHFAADIDKETEIATRLHKELSGIACPTYIVDVPNGHGKIPVPLNFMNADKARVRDFEGVEHYIKE